MEWVGYLQMLNDYQRWNILPERTGRVPMNDT